MYLKNPRIETIISYIADIMAVNNRLSKKSVRHPYLKFSVVISWVVIGSKNNWRLQLDVSISMLWSSSRECRNIISLLNKQKGIMKFGRRKLYKSYI